MEEEANNLKYYPDWDQPQGKTSKRGLRVHIHPYDLIIYIQKKDGLAKAGEVAVKLISAKYARLLDELKS